LYRLQRTNNKKHYLQTKKTYAQTKDFVHLTYDERRNFVREIARHISQWGYTRLFAECIDKVYFDPIKAGKTIDEQCFEQIVSRFEYYLKAIEASDPNCCGLLIHDNNQTVARKHTILMRKYHKIGTMWTRVTKIIETPLFVDSQLTSMVQIADLCAYAIRRYLENGEEELFNLVFMRADRRDGAIVGVRHFTKPGCGCKICAQHRIIANLQLMP
jgi:hypothetical protein